MIIEKEIKRLNRILKELKTDCTTIPDDSEIYFKKKNDNYYLYIRKRIAKGRYYDQYVSVKNPEILSIINTGYASKLIPLLNEEILALKNFQRDYRPEKKFEVIRKVPLCMKSMLLHPVKDYRTIAEEWSNERFYSNSYPIDNKQYAGKSGQYFRSKAEYIIAQILEELGIPYRYENAYEINEKTVFPDFTIMSPFTGELFYIEYFGLMDNPDYAQNALKKIAAYQQGPDAGRFVYFFESSSNPMSIDGIRNTIIKTLDFDR